MDTKLKARWVKALRSGKYRQGQHELKDGDEYCCLGVLCDLDPEVEFDGSLAYVGEVCIGSGALERPGLKRFGIPQRVMNRLVQLNDGETPKGPIQPRNFKEIADWIEKSRQL